MKPPCSPCWRAAKPRPTPKLSGLPWVESNQPLLLAGMLETDPATLLGELGSDQHRQYNLAICRMLGGDDAQLKQFIQQVVDTGLAELAKAAWNDHVAALHNAMSEDQWEQYQDRRNAA